MKKENCPKFYIFQLMRPVLMHSPMQNYLTPVSQLGWSKQTLCSIILLEISKNTITPNSFPQVPTPPLLVWPFGISLARGGGGVEDDLPWSRDHSPSASPERLMLTSTKFRRKYKNLILGGELYIAGEEASTRLVSTSSPLFRNAFWIKFKKRKSFATIMSRFGLFWSNSTGR